MSRGLLLVLPLSFLSYFGARYAGDWLALATQHNPDGARTVAGLIAGLTVGAILFGRRNS